MCSENERPDRLIRMLYDIADDAEAPANSRLSAIKEILDRTVGKGVMLGSSCCEEPCRSWSARLYRRLCGCIRSALQSTR